MAMKPYRMQLKKVSSEEQRLVTAIYSYLPATGVEDDVIRGIKNAVSKTLGEEISFRLETLKREKFGDFLSKMPASSVLAVVGMAPLSHKAVIEIDTPLAMMFIERLLGGQADSMPEPRELSDTEQGVLQYLLLQVLAGIHRLTGADARVHFRFERFAFHSHEIRGLAEPADGVATLSFRLGFGRHSGFVRLSLPDPFVNEAFLGNEQPGEARPAEAARRLKQVSRFAHVKSQMWAEAGRTTILPTDLKQLEEGDVIIFDQKYTSVVGNQPADTALIRFGNGTGGGLDTELELTPARARCRVTGIHKGE